MQMSKNFSFKTLLLSLEKQGILFESLILKSIKTKFHKPRMPKKNLRSSKKIKQVYP